MRDGSRMGMLARVPHLDEASAAMRYTSTPAKWLTPPIEVDDDLLPIAPGKTARGRKPTGGDVEGDGEPSGAGDRLLAAFGVTAPTRTTAKEWIMARLAVAPQTAVALLDRPDCPVKKPQLYAALNQLVDDGKLVEPRKGGYWEVRENGGPR